MRLLAAFKGHRPLALALGGGLLFTLALVIGSMWPVLNDVTTGETAAYPDLEPRYYSTTIERVEREIVGAITDLPRFELIQEEGSTIEATATTRVFRFVDDLTISIEPMTEFVVRVRVRSRSRVGRSDFGQNARNIEELFKELDARLGQVRFTPGT